MAVPPPESGSTTLPPPDAYNQGLLQSAAVAGSVVAAHELINTNLQSRGAFNDIPNGIRTIGGGTARGYISPYNIGLLQTAMYAGSDTATRELAAYNPPARIAIPTVPTYDKYAPPPEGGGWAFGGYHGNTATGEGGENLARAVENANREDYHPGSEANILNAGRDPYLIAAAHGFEPQNAQQINTLVTQGRSAFMKSLTPQTSDLPASRLSDRYTPYEIDSKYAPPAEGGVWAFGGFHGNTMTGEGSENLPFATELEARAGYHPGYEANMMNAGTNPELVALAQHYEPQNAQQITEMLVGHGDHVDNGLMNKAIGEGYAKPSLPPGFITPGGSPRASVLDYFGKLQVLSLNEQRLSDVEKTYAGDIAKYTKNGMATDRAAYDLLNAEYGKVNLAYQFVSGEYNELKTQYPDDVMKSIFGSFDFIGTKNPFKEGSNAWYNYEETQREVVAGSNTLPVMLKTPFISSPSSNNPSSESTGFMADLVKNGNQFFGSLSSVPLLSVLTSANEAGKLITTKSALEASTKSYNDLFSDYEKKGLVLPEGVSGPVKGLSPEQYSDLNAKYSNLVALQGNVNKYQSDITTRPFVNFPVNVERGISPESFLKSAALGLNPLSMMVNVGARYFASEGGIEKTNQYLQTLIPTDETLNKSNDFLQSSVGRSFIGALLPGNALTFQDQALRATTSLAQPFVSKNTDLTKLPSGLDVSREMAIGNIQGARDNPLESMFWFGVAYAVPGASAFVEDRLAASTTFQAMKNWKYIPAEGGALSRLGFEEIQPGKMLFGTIASRNVPLIENEELTNVMAVNKVSEVQAGRIALETNLNWLEGTRHINLPIAALEIGLGTWYAQSVIQRATTIPGSQTPGIMPRINWGDNGLAQNPVNMNAMPSWNQMARTFGQINANEIFPAYAGATLGTSQWEKVYGSLRTIGKEYVSMRGEDIPSLNANDVQKTTGIGWESQYPVNPNVNQYNLNSLVKSFQKGTFTPEPTEMIGANRVRSPVEYVPESTFLPGELPYEQTGAYSAWTAWDIPVGNKGSTFTLQKGTSEVKGMAMGPGVYGYFTKVNSGQDIQLFGLGLPTIKRPTIVRTSGFELTPFPENIRAAGYKAMNTWALVEGKPNTVYMQGQKAEYEAALPWMTGEGTRQTQLSIDNVRYFTKIEGVKVPIAEATIKSTPVIQKLNPQKELKPSLWKDILEDVIQKPGKNPIFGEENLNEQTLLSKFKTPQDRKAAQNVLDIMKEVENTPRLKGGNLDLSQIESVGTKYTPDVEKVLQKTPGATIYGSATRTAYMSPNEILTNYGKLPGDIDFRANNIFTAAKDISDVWGNQVSTKVTYAKDVPGKVFGISVSRKVSGIPEEIADIHPQSVTNEGNPLGWPQLSLVKSEKGISYTPFEQQIQNMSGTMLGREGRGGWEFGPRINRVEKDTLGYYSDLRFLLEKQENLNAPTVVSIRNSARELRQHPYIGNALKGRKFVYGSGPDQFFAGLDLSEYYGKSNSIVNLTTLGVSSALFSAATKGKYDIYQNIFGTSQNSFTSPSIKNSSKISMRGISQKPQNYKFFEESISWKQPRYPQKPSSSITSKYSISTPAEKSSPGMSKTSYTPPSSYSGYRSSYYQTGYPPSYPPGYPTGYPPSYPPSYPPGYPPEYPPSSPPFSPPTPPTNTYMITADFSNPWMTSKKKRKKKAEEHYIWNPTPGIADVFGNAFAMPFQNMEKVLKTKSKYPGPGKYKVFPSKRVGKEKRG